MKSRSCKNKGQRAAKEVKESICETLSIHTDDIRVTPSGVFGEDLTFSKSARDAFPFIVEVKNQEKMNVWESLAKAKRHAVKVGGNPILIFTRNRTPMYCALEFPVFLELLLVLKRLTMIEKEKATSDQVCV